MTSDLVLAPGYAVGRRVGERFPHLLKQLLIVATGDLRNCLAGLDKLIDLPTLADILDRLQNIVDGEQVRGGALGVSDDLVGGRGSGGGVWGNGGV